MLILAGVSLNAIIGDNGIITNAQTANLKNQKAILQEYFDHFYVEHYEEFENEVNKASVLQSLNASKNWIYKGKLGYVVDETGYVHYFLIIENMPKEVRESIKIGIGEKTYSDYANCKDVWGVTEDLKVYYCADGLDSIDGVELASLGKENGKDTAFSAGSNLAKIISGGDTTKSISKSDLRSVNKLVLDSSSEVENLNDMYNFVALRDLTLQDLTLESLDGIEYLAKVYRIYIIRCTIKDYSKLSEIASQIQYLFFEDTNNEEIRKFCSAENGISGVDFDNLAYFGIYGVRHFEPDYVYTERKGVYPVSNSTNVYRSSFSDMSYLSQLSTITKERVRNLFLNNNSLSNIDNIYEFSGVTLLRVEDNYLENLNGLYHIFYNDKGEITSTKGLTSLEQLHAYSNYLGVDEDSTELNPSVDTLSIFANSILDQSTSTYSFVNRFENLSILYVDYSNLIWLDYLSCNSTLSSLGISGISTLNLASGVQSMIGIFEKTSFSLSCDTYVRDYVNDNSKVMAFVPLGSKTMTTTEFANYLSGRENYAKKLDISKLKLTDASGNPITNETTTKYNAVIEASLENLTGIEALSCNGLSYLTSIDFVQYMPSLNNIDLRGTSVVDLQPLVDYCSENIAQVVIDNESIPIANEEDEDGNREISAVESLINITYDNSIGSYYFTGGYGVVIMNRELISQFQYTKNITKFAVSYLYFGTNTLGKDLVTFDLRNNPITIFKLFGSRNF